MGRQSNPGLRAEGLALALCAAVALLACYARRLGLDLPLYAADEGTYLIRALFGDRLAADPGLAPYIPDIDNTVFLAILRGLSLLTPSVLEAARTLGALAYFAGLLFTYRAVRPDLAARHRWAFLLLALIYPYHRFVFTALPEGWYVGLLGLMVLLTARLYRSRPFLHALGIGALAATLVLIKPHGVAVAVALVALMLIDAALDRRRDLRVLAGRLSLSTLGFLAAGNGIQLLEGRPLGNPLLFFGHGFYGEVLGTKVTEAGWTAGLPGLLAMGSGIILCAGIPVLAGVADIARRRRTQPDLRLGATDLAFLLLLLALAATTAMVTIFTFKISLTSPGESHRLWGRYFEFFVPLLWLTAAPAILRWEALRDRRIRWTAAAMVLLGLAGLSASLFAGVMLFPWDAAGLSAFFRPDLTKWPTVAPFPLFAWAVAASVLAALLTLTSVRTVWIWQGFFAALALFSSTLDEAWLAEILPARVVLGLEVGGARLLVAPTHGPVAAFYDDVNTAPPIILKLRARPRMILLAPGAPVNTARFRPFETVIVQGDHPLEGPGWALVQPGLQVKVYRRAR